MKTTWLWLALAASILMGAASVAGLLLPFVYVNETASWAAQGMGQDVVNLVVVLPAIVACLYWVAHGSVRAALVALGLLMYIVYSYVLYAFFVHFNALFPIYVAVLGLSFYALVGGSLVARRQPVRDLFAGKSGRAQSAYLMASGVLFAGLWLSSIAAAIVSGETPRDLLEVGLPVNPVHVLDLAFVLPAMIVTSILLWKGHPLGYQFAVPLITFAAAMGAAIVGMMLMMKASGLAAPFELVAVMAFSSALAVYLTVDFLLPTMQHAYTIFSSDVRRRPSR